MILLIFLYKLDNINIDKEELNNIEPVLNIIGRLLGISK